MRKHALAAVLLGSVGLWCALIAGIDLAIIFLGFRLNPEKAAPESILAAIVTVVPIVKTALFTPGSPSSALLYANALFSGSAALLNVVAALLVYRRRPVGSLLAALVGACLIGFSLYHVLVLYSGAVRDGAQWYVSAVLTLFGLAVLSYVLGLWAIPSHGGSRASGAFTPRVLAAGAAAIASLAVGGFLWQLASEYSRQPSLVTLVISVVAPVGLAVLAKASARRGGSKGVLISGGLLTFLFVVLVAFLLDYFEIPFVMALGVAPFAAAPLLLGMARLVGEPGTAARAAGRAPAVLIGATALAGPVIALLGVVGIDQARRIANDPAVGDSFLDSAAVGLRVYAVLFAVVVVILLVLVRRVWSRGGTPGTQIAVFGWGLLHLVLLVFAASITPFVIGDSDEGVHRVVVEGPSWYVPTVRMILVCSALALAAAAALLVRGRSGSGGADEGVGEGT